MRRLPPLGALRAFEAAARRSSFKLAAEELNVTPTAVSHQIRQLEEFLANRLFDRGTRSVRLTAAGHQLYPVLRDGFDAFARAVQDVRQSASKRSAVLTSTVAFMARCLAPRAGHFRERFPDWDLRLDASNGVVDLDSAADVAIRYGSGDYPGMQVTPLFRDRFAPVCSPALGIRTLDDLRAAPLIHFDWGPAMRSNENAPVWRHWLAAAGATGVPADSGERFTDEIHDVQATESGQGIGLLSLALVWDELQAGVLVQPFPLVLESFGYYLISSPRRAADPAVRVLRDWVLTELGLPDTLQAN
jgi:LysR family glycine cleavage system transcriptional activator